MKFVNEKNNAAFARRNFTQNCFESFLKFTAEFRSCKQRANIKCNDPRSTHRLWTVTIHDALRESFCDRSLANARLANQHRIIFRPPRQDLHAPANFFITADDGIKLSVGSKFVQVFSIFLESFICALCTRIVNTLHSTCFANVACGSFKILRIRTNSGENILSCPASLRSRNQQVIAGDVCVLHLQRESLCSTNHFHQFTSSIRSRTLDARLAR